MAASKNAAEENLQPLLQSRLDEAAALLNECETVFKNVAGVGKLRGKIRAELQFLHELKDKPSGLLAKHLETSNVIHFRGILLAAERANGCVAVLKSFPRAGSRAKLDVDLVVADGAQWIKVISRSPRSLFLELVGANSGSGRSIIDQGRDYVGTAKNYPHLFRSPKVTFEFIAGLPDRLADELRELGIDVVGSEIPICELGAPPESDDDSDEDVDDEEQNSSADEEGSGEDEVEDDDDENDEDDTLPPEGYHTINLDITAVFVMVSALTHAGGANFKFREPLLDSQAVIERQKPALPPVLNAVQGKRLIICQTAYDSVRSILSTVAGENERKRADELLKRVEIVEDRTSARAAALKLSDKVSNRAKVIFGAGDYYKAVTMTANRHFVQAASHQGTHFAVILHDSRALSEQKQARATPLFNNNTVEKSTLPNISVPRDS
uniref:DUF1308 domain-containing protein n=1 Tax=Plectus sambesii TaxID=2011161 RepID=A0A914XS49_9BILA